MAWVTNMAPPYRVPVWNALAQSVDLTVLLLADERQFERLQRTRNRSSEWIRPTDPDFAVESVRTTAFSLRGRPTYVLRSSPAERYDCVVLGGWEQPAYFQLKRWARRSGSTLIGFYESTSQSQRFSRGPVARARSGYFADMDCVVAPGSGPAQALLHAGVARDRILQGFNPVDVDKFRRTTSMDRGPSATHNFLYVGQLIERKNVINLVRAFASPSFRSDNLTIVGKGHLEQTLLAEVARLGVADRVRLIGAVPNDELPSVMWEHDTLVLPSTEEVWGLVVNEALAGGLHAVVSTRAGIFEDIRHMSGVIPTDVAIDQIAKSMAKSKTQWRGPVPEPDILKHSPSALADLIADAVRSPA